MYIHVTATVYLIMHSGIFCKVSHIKTITKLLYQNSSLTHACMHTYLLSKYIYMLHLKAIHLHVSCKMTCDFRWDGGGGYSKLLGIFFFSLLKVPVYLRRRNLRVLSFSSCNTCMHVHDVYILHT